MRLDNFGTTEESGYVYSVSAAGAIRFENRLIGPDPGDPDARGFTGKKHIRILVEGTLNKDALVYESIDKYEAISSDYRGDSTLATIKGTTAGGFFVHGKHCRGPTCNTYAGFTQTVSQCLTKDLCKENIGLLFDSEEKYKFALNDYSLENNTPGMGKFLSKATLPLKFESVTFSDLP